MSDNLKYSWGNYPKPAVQNIIPFDSYRRNGVVPPAAIAYGNGRSYGDSCLGNNLVTMEDQAYLLDFDASTGLLKVQSGVKLKDILEVFVPRGWFISITPGTKLITVGGAIAADVHGKNHHQNGCFSECVKSFRLLMPDSEIVTCSKTENRELFKLTCGGMGLTGMIVDAQIYLKKINSQNIAQTTIKTKHLHETFDAFETYKHYKYSVAWIDCLAKGKAVGRALLTVGDFAHDQNLNYKTKNNQNIPFYFPNFTLNKTTVNIFNTLYYAKVRKAISHKTVPLDTFFYPLDSLNNWNRIYGQNGFLQYQFILPKQNSFIGLKKILNRIAETGWGSFLAVLKLYGAENENYLSFPIEGYSLALDFKIKPKLFKFLDELDQLVIQYGGRVYLAKDARISKQNFEKGYPMIEKFRSQRKKYGFDKVYQSLQSQRLSL